MTTLDFDAIIGEAYEYWEAEPKEVETITDKDEIERLMLHVFAVPRSPAKVISFLTNKYYTDNQTTRQVFQHLLAFKKIRYDAPYTCVRTE